jgi:hypothetical protein
MGIKQFASVACASAALVLWSCGGGGGSDSTTPPPPTVTPLSVNTSSLPSGQVGVAYSQTLSASGGTAPYTWSSGVLPAGLSLATSTGVVSGTPTTAVSSSSITFTVTDSGTPTQSKSVTLSLTIAGAPTPLSISTSSLPNGTVGTAYSTSLGASGGTSPYSWTVSGGTLPAGLALSGATISGTPTATANAVALTFKVTDSSTPTQSKSTTLALTVIASFSVTTITLPNGQIGSPYSATLAASGGIAPITWSQTGATALPAGLSLNATTGQISGTPTAPANQSKITFQATDSSNPAQTAPVTLTLNVSPAVINISLSQTRAALTTTQQLVLSATTTDNAGVSWTVSPSGGSFNPTTTTTGSNVTFTAPSSAGVYTVTATSVTDGKTTSSATVAVTDLAGVYSYHNDAARDGVNAQEYALTTSTVSTSSFGKLFSCNVDGAVYAQPVWVAKLTVSGAQHNVVFIATEHDSLFAFDADTSPCQTLWQVSLIDSSHGGTSGEQTVPSGGPGGHYVGSGIGDMQPEVGITGTPVIDPSTGTLYVVSKSMNSGATAFYQRLHAIDITTGNEKSSSSPILIAGSVNGTGDGSTTVTFNAQEENQRAGLVLVNGAIYIIWASHEDDNPYYGWVMGYTYNGSTFSQTQILNVSPNAGYSGVWMSGSAPASDSSGNLYMITGNGVFDVNSGGSDYGDSYLKLSTASNLTVADYFTPSDQSSDNSNDGDFGAGGAAVLVDLPNSAPVQHLAIGGGKDGNLYVLNRDNMGHYDDPNNPQNPPPYWQQVGVGSGIFATPAVWNNELYVAPQGGALSSYTLNTSNAKFSFSPTSTASSPSFFGFPGSTPSVSASGTANGIVWALDNGLSCVGKSYAPPPNPKCGPTVLHAYDATNLNELWNSSMVGADAAGNAVKFNVPTIANGKVYVGSRGNNTGVLATQTGGLDVYGVKPN